MRVQFSGEMFHWRGPAPFHFVAVPPEPCTALRDVSPMVTYGWGMVPIRVRVGSTEWTTAAFPKDGGYLVPIKAAVRKAEALELGQTVEMTVTTDL